MWISQNDTPTFFSETVLLFSNAGDSFFGNVAVLAVVPKNGYLFCEATCNSTKMHNLAIKGMEILCERNVDSLSVEIEKD